MSGPPLAAVATVTGCRDTGPEAAISGRVPEPSDAMIQISAWSTPRLVSNRIHCPSGDHAGLSLLRGSGVSVRRRGPEGSPMRTDHTSPNWVSTPAQNTSRPARESSGTLASG